MIRPVLETALAEMNQKLSVEIIQSFELFASELKKWNSKFNLTAICNDSDIAVKHLIDSSILASHVAEKEAALDIGSGAGIPAIPLKIIKPDVRVVSVDAVGKKIMFQRHVARLLNLNSYEALHARVESMHATHAGFFDVITSRAFSSLKMFVTLGEPLLKPGGRMIAMKGPMVQSEIDDSRAELLRLGYEISSLKRYSLPMSKGERCLVTISPMKAHQ